VRPLAMEPVRGPEGPERLRQIGLHALIAEVGLERVGAVALDADFTVASRKCANDRRPFRI
jgi:hypothetical protein